ncbi:MAG: hypothetical protein EBS29_12560 [Chloroflexia bacterium]|nr:hypothetical protein [Chloroflexia bacterium]
MRLAASDIVVPNANQLDIGVIEGLSGVVLGVYMPKTQDNNTNHCSGLSLYGQRRLYTLTKEEV